MAKGFIIVCLLSLVPLGGYIYVGGNIAPFCIPLMFGLMVLLIARLRNAQPLLIMAFYLYIYFLYLIPYFTSGTKLSEYSTYQQTDLFNRVLFQFYVYYTGMATATFPMINPSRRRLADLQSFRISKLNIVFYLLAFIVIVRITLSYGVNVLLADNPYHAYIDNLENTNAMPLFCILALLIGLVMMHNARQRNMLLGVAGTVLVWYYVTHGYRIVLTSILMVIFIYCFELRIKTRTLLLTCLAGAILILLLDVFKHGDEIDFRLLFSENDGDYIMSHHADNLYGAAAMNAVWRDGLLSIWDRILLTIGFPLEAIIPPALLPLYMKYPLFIAQYTTVGGGGLVPTGCYLMWGYLGTFLFPFGLIRLMAYIYAGKGGGYLRLIGLVAMVFCFHWTSYDFHVILRFPLYACIVLYLARKINMTSLFLPSQNRLNS